ncbi:MAG: glycosyltransferase family 4 protein [Planctomycetes bacterium]|nr:glycosyltransferase family 4 protein [Planctomycetota bacterium]
MKLLFLTQVLDRGDAVLGFVSRWVRALAAQCEAVRVVALEVGDTSDLPPNVDWREVGRRGRLGRYLRYKRLLREAFGTDGYDTVLAHMVPRYTLVSDAPARRAGARRFLWYTHAGVDARLRRAVPLVEKVFTASPESLRLDAPNKVVTGHGIDLEHFGRPEHGAPARPPRLLSVGRLTPKKDPLTVLEATARLVARGRDVHLDLVGAGLTGSDAGYRDEVTARIARLGLGERVVLHGAVPYVDVPWSYARATVVINASLTGSLDKVTLEAMASRRPVVSCNDTSPRLFAELGDAGAALCFPAGDADALAQRLERLLDLDDAQRLALGERLRAIVARDHEVDVLAARLVREMGGGA